MKLKSEQQNTRDDSGSTKRLTINNLAITTVSLKISIQKAYGSVTDEKCKIYQSSSHYHPGEANKVWLKSTPILAEYFVLETDSWQRPCYSRRNPRCTSREDNYSNSGHDCANDDTADNYDDTDYRDGTSKTDRV